VQGTRIRTASRPTFGAPVSASATPERLRPADPAGFEPGWYYLLNGETRSSIGIVKSFSPFDIRKGKFGTGSIEPFFWSGYLDIGG
jgi:hypothetical protein